MIPFLPKWANYSIIVILLFGIIAMFIFSVNNKLDQEVFIKKFDARTKLSDQRYQAEKAADADRTRKVDQLINETAKTVNDLIYILQIRLSNHTIHTDKELGDLNGNLTKLILIETRLLENRTPLFADILENQRIGIQNQYLFGKQLNVSGISNHTR